MIIAASGDMKQLYDIPKTVRTEIENTIRILDCYYGENRDIFHGMGGFVFIAQNTDDIRYLSETWKIDLQNDTAENELITDGYVIKLFILNSDYIIKVIYKEELLWK